MRSYGWPIDANAGFTWRLIFALARPISSWRQCPAAAMLCDASGRSPANPEDLFRLDHTLIDITHTRTCTRAPAYDFCPRKIPRTIHRKEQAPEFQSPACVGLLRPTIHQLYTGALARRAVPLGPPAAPLSVAHLPAATVILPLPCNRQRGSRCRGTSARAVAAHVCTAGLSGHRYSAFRAPI